MLQGFGRLIEICDGFRSGRSCNGNVCASNVDFLALVGLCQNGRDLIGLARSALYKEVVWADLTVNPPFLMKQVQSVQYDLCRKHHFLLKQVGHLA